MKELPEIKLPARTTSNIVYDADLRQYVLGPKLVTRTARNVKHLRPLSQLLWVAFFSKQLGEKKKTSTLRDAFYNAIGFGIDFEDQNESDNVVTELESLLGIIREDLTSILKSGQASSAPYSFSTTCLDTRGAG